MSTSQNGWPVNPERVDLAVHGIDYVGGVRAGDVATVLGYVAKQLAARVELGRVGQCWGWAPRPIRGQTTGFSNHASATAIDHNSLRHPRGAHGTFSPAQVAVIHEILDETAGVVRWGGDYTSGPVDEMHFEINSGTARVTLIANELAEKGTVMDSEIKRAFVETQRRVDEVQETVAAIRHYTDARQSETLNVVRALALAAGVPQAELDKIQKAARS